MQTQKNELLRVENICKQFGGVTALNGVSFSFEPGLVTGLIGPNGSGKSTLFNIITGFLKQDKGDVLFDNQNLNGSPAYAIARKGLYRSFQMSLQPKKMTVMEIMLLSPGAQMGEGLLRSIFQFKAIRQQEQLHLSRAWEILEMIQMEDKADTLVGELSGGQKKLLSLGQALMVRPRLILLDEPVAGVNPKLIDKICEILLKLKDQGHNFLIVEHNMNFVRQVCDTVYVLDAGEVIAEGPTAQTLESEEVLHAYLAGTRT